jgi:DNA (cytosine-5)-methyltransferase 3A
MSCGQQALNRLGIKYDNYYASELDKYAIQITQKNYPDTIQLGDVCGVVAKDLPKVDLLLAGSPCQGFSFAGKQLAFDDPRSALFFEFVRLLRELKPKYFLLENVRMKKEYLDVITEQVGGIEPILINSKLVSAQNRQRYYWTNIPNVTQPEDRGLVLRDVLEDYTDDVYLAGEKLQKNYKGGNQLNPNYKSQANTIHDVNKKSGTICAGTHGYANGYVGTPKQVGTAVDIRGYDIIKRVYSPDGKSPALTTMQGGHRQPKVVTGAWRGRYNKDGSTTQKLELRRDDKTNSLTTVQKDNVVVTTKPNQVNPSKDAGGKQPYMQDRVFDERGKSHALTASFASRTNVATDVHWRKLTPLECERLQTVDDNYTEGVSNTQRYKMLGNGWTVDVISHILSNIK